MSRQKGDLYYSQDTFLEAVPKTPDFKTTETIQKEVSAKLERTISWGTTQKYLCMLEQEGKIIRRQISRYNNWTKEK